MYRSTSCPVVHLLSLLYSCPYLQFSVSTVIHSVQSAVCTVCYSYRWMPVWFFACRYSVPVIIYLYTHPFVLSSICTDVCLYSCSSVQSSICTVFWLYSHPFSTVCNLYRWCLYSYLRVHTVLLIFCTVIRLYSHLSVQLSVCTVIVCTVVSLCSRQPVQLVCIVGRLQSCPAVQSTVCTVCLEFCLFCLPSVQIDACTDGQLFRQLTVLYGQLYRQHWQIVQTADWGGGQIVQIADCVTCVTDLVLSLTGNI